MEHNYDWMLKYNNPEGRKKILNGMFEDIDKMRKNLDNKDKYRHDFECALGRLYNHVFMLEKMEEK